MIIYIELDWESFDVKDLERNRIQQIVCYKGKSSTNQACSFIFPYHMIDITVLACIVAEDEILMNETRNKNHKNNPNSMSAIKICHSVCYLSSPGKKAYIFHMPMNKSHN